MHFWRIFYLYLDFGLHIFKGRSLQNPRKVQNETLFHWLTKPNRKRKYNDFRKEHSRFPSFGRKSSAELFRRTSSSQLKEGFRFKMHSTESMQVKGSCVTNETPPWYVNFNLFLYLVFLISIYQLVATCAKLTLLHRSLASFPQSASILISLLPLCSCLNCFATSSFSKCPCITVAFPMESR